VKIQQVIVVEGEHDRRNVLASVEADVEITGGFAITGELIQRLTALQQRRGLIIMTDPDYTGEVIRRILYQRIPGVEHAYIAKVDAEHLGDVGIENARPEAIRKALASLKKETLFLKNTFTMQDLYQLHLTGHPNSGELRLLVANQLKIGYGNGKKFCRQLNTYQISPSELAEALELCKEVIIH
jgi:ribonuclease M5